MVGEPPVSEEKSEQENQVKEPEVLEAGLADDVEMLKLSNTLGLENVAEARQYQDKIQTIAKWASAKGAVSMDDAVNMIRELGARLGGPREGKRYVQNLAEYTYLELEKIKIDKALKGLEI